MTYTDEDVERVALKICEALGDWNPVPMNKMAYEDAARAAIAASAELFQRKKDDGRSDAALIAKYGATQMESL